MIVVQNVIYYEWILCMHCWKMINTQLKLYQECTFSFHYLLRVHKSKSKTGVEFADSDRWNQGNFFTLSISELANWVKPENHQTFLHQQEQKGYILSRAG